MALIHHIRKLKFQSIIRLIGQLLREFLQKCVLVFLVDEFRADLELWIRLSHLLCEVFRQVVSGDVEIARDDAAVAFWIERHL